MLHPCVLKAIMPLALGVGLLGSVALAGNIPADLQAEAEKIQAQSFTKCGDDYYTQFPSLPVESASLVSPAKKPPAKLSARFGQYKDLRVVVRAEDVSAVDTLNGVQWRGYVTFSAFAGREFHEHGRPDFLFPVPQGWSEWKSGGPLGIGWHLEHKQGQLTVTPMILAHMKPMAPMCADLPQQ